MITISYDKKRVKSFFLNITRLVILLSIFSNMLFPIDNTSKHDNKVYAAESTIDATVNTALNNNKNQPVLVFTSATVGYMFYCETTGTIGYSKTSDGGATWASYVATTSQSDIAGYSIWYDQWTPGDTSGTKIHISMIDTSADDVWYDTLDTNGDSQGTEAAISTVYGNTIAAVDEVTITKATDGVLYILSSNGTAATVARKCSTTCATASNWSDAGTTPLDNANDYIRVVPLASGNIMVIRDDVSAEDIQSKVYTASSNTWDSSWTNIDTSASDSTTYLETIAVTVRKSNNDIYLAYGAGVAAAGTADIRTAIYSSGSWSAKTAVISSQNTLTNLSLTIRDGTDDAYVAYLKGTAGSSMNVYYKRSTDGMTSWGNEAQLNSTVTNADFRWMYMNVLSDKLIYAAWEGNTGTDDAMYGAIVEEFGTVTVGTSGTQTSGMFSSTTNNYVGGAFTLTRDYGTASVTQIKISEKGTVDANADLSNLDIYYETAGTCTYNANETLFGTGTSFNASDEATVTGTISSSTSQICLYVLVDIGAGITTNETLEIEISVPSSDVTVSKGVASPGSAISISGSTTLTVTVISVTVSDGAISYGIMAANASKSTLSGELNDMQTATNAGNRVSTFNIKGINATGGGCTWTLASTTSSDQYVHRFCNDTANDCSSPPTNYTALTTGYQTLASGVAISGTRDIQLRITTPTLSSCFGQQSANVTVQAVGE